jgi:multicomponent Na+:H+ antiporter subunit G
MAGDLALGGLGVLLIAVGLVCMAGGTIGLLRFPDFYTRLHAVRVSDGLGTAIVLLGLAVVSGDTAIAVRLVLLAALVAALAPTFSHLLAHAAHAAGLAPLAGRYVAPRPSARRESSS